MRRQITHASESAEGTSTDIVDHGSRARKSVSTVHRHRAGVRSILAMMAVLGVGGIGLEAKAEEGREPATIEKLEPELEAYRAPLENMLRKQDPNVFTEAVLKTSTMRTTVNGILRGFHRSNNWARLEQLKSGQDFALFQSELQIIMAAIQKAHDWEQLQEIDPAEVSLIRTLKRSADNKDFPTLVGSDTIANNLSRQYRIESYEYRGENYVVIFDHEGSHMVGILDSLAPFIPENYRGHFKKTIDWQLNENATAAARKDLSNSASTHEVILNEVYEIQQKLRDYNLSGRMYFTQEVSKFFQLWQAVNAALKNQDIQTAKEILAIITDKPSGDPSEVLSINRMNWKAILYKNPPPEADEAVYINQLLSAYLQPRGREADALWNPETAKKAGITNARDLANLNRLRSAAPPTIAIHLAEQFGFEAITEIQKQGDVVIIKGATSAGSIYIIFFNTTTKMTTVSQQVPMGLKGTASIATVNYKNIREALIGPAEVEKERREAEAATKARAAAAATEAAAAKERARYEGGVYQGSEADAGWILLKGRRADDGLVNGKGEARREDGVTYVGEYLDGKRHGRGTWTHPNGEKYSGEWDDDKMHGKGTYTWPDGIVFTGEWNEGKRIDETGTWSFKHSKYKTPNAMYVYAGQLETEGKMFQAKVVYNHIIKTFPNSPVTIRATDRLRQIREAGAAAQASQEATVQQKRQALQQCLHGCDTNKASQRVYCDTLSDYAITRFPRNQYERDQRAFGFGLYRTSERNDCIVAAGDAYESCSESCNRQYQ